MIVTISPRGLGNATAAIEGFQFLKKRCLRKSKTPDLSERAPNEHPTSFGLRGAHDDGDGGGDGQHTSS